MAVVYPTAVKTARLQAVLTALGASGKLEIGTTGMASILAVIPLGAGGSVTGAVWTLLAAPASDASADNTGAAAAARLRTSANVDIVTGLTVGLTGSDINLDSLSITAGQTVTVNSATITHAA